MFGIAFSELLLTLIIAFLIFGGKDFIASLKSLFKLIYKFKLFIHNLETQTDFHLVKDQIRQVKQEAEKEIAAINHSIEENIKEHIIDTTEIKGDDGKSYFAYGDKTMEELLAMKRNSSNFNNSDSDSGSESNSNAADSAFSSITDSKSVPNSNSHNSNPFK